MSEQGSEGTPDAPALRPLKAQHLEAARALLARACAHDPAARVAREKLFGPAAAHAGALAIGAFTGSAFAGGAFTGGAFAGSAFAGSAFTGSAFAGGAFTGGAFTGSAFAGGAFAGGAFTGGAFAGAELAGVVAVSGPWIRLLAVDPAQRGRGLGSALLHAAEQAVRDAGERTVRVLDQPGNYLAPGIDARNRETIAWLERRGYARHGERTNLLVSLRPAERIPDARARAAGPAYELRRATRADADALGAMITAGFSTAWAFEVGQALGCDPPAVHVAVERAGGALVAFAAHDGNNRGLGWFGPTGTLPEHRGRGLGAALLRACLADLAAAGHETCEVAWIGPREFYQRVAGVAGERRFVAMRKELP